MSYKKKTRPGQSTAYEQNEAPAEINAEFEIRQPTHFTRVSNRQQTAVIYDFVESLKHPMASRIWDRPVAR